MYLKFCRYLGKILRCLSEGSILIVNKQQLGGSEVVRVSKQKASRKSTCVTGVTAQKLIGRSEYLSIPEHPQKVKHRD